MNKAIESQLLKALELFHYSYRFRSSLFVLTLDPAVSLSSILLDLKLLQSSHISVLLITEHQKELEEQIRKLSLRGLRFSYRRLELVEPLSDASRTEIRLLLKNDSIPVLAVPQTGSKESNDLYCRSVSAAVQLEADKLFLLSPMRGLLVDGVLHSHVSTKEASSLLSKTYSMNISRELLRLFLGANREHGLEIVLLDASTGSLFQEIFTHQGRGTLFTNDYPNLIRRGKLEDVFEISRLLRPYIEEGLILATTEDEIANQIRSYYVYTVNRAIVAAAQLVDYGSASALSKFCTLPRYQGKGRAKQLARKMIKTANKQGKEYVFALSISPKMWGFFTDLGLNEVARDLLPAAWKKDYDFSRPSRAFRLMF